MGKTTSKAIHPSAPDEDGTRIRFAAELAQGADVAAPIAHATIAERILNSASV